MALVRSVNRDAWVIIKSTVPVGYTAKLRARTSDGRILFSPEFLREGRALYDNLHPSRVVVGAPGNDAACVAAAGRFADLLLDGAVAGRRRLAPGKGATRDRAADAQDRGGHDRGRGGEAVRQHLPGAARRLLHELDTYCEVRGLSSVDVIGGVCLDPRIGAHYKQPVVWLRGLLPAQGHEAAARQLPGHPAGARRGRRGLEQDAQGPCGRRGGAAGEQARLLGRADAHGRHLPPHHEERVGQLPLLVPSRGSCGASGPGASPVLVYEPTLEASEFFGSEVTHDLRASRSAAPSSWPTAGATSSPTWRTRCTRATCLGGTDP